MREATKAELESQNGTNSWLIVTLNEGKNREIRRLMESFGLQVTRLIRTAYGPFQLGSLAVGAVEEIRGKILQDQVGALTAYRVEKHTHKQKKA